MSASSCETTPDVSGIVRRYYELVDAKDFAAMSRLFADEVIYHRPGYAPMRGLSQVLAFYEQIRVIESGRHELHTVVTDGSTVAVTGTFEGRVKGGRRVTQAFADFFEVENGQIVTRSTYFDAPAL
ncbi:MAG: nuclear transport factor 2 family protein [Hamadaea sp.]|nr:nuclear transport factor 2 family protein [Hamadaea sp.]NUT23008.1 nuclear transport factor 2 family protein [Hamadaea sp.]